jgi:NADH-quinone oxidoreductase subunit C
MSSTSLTAPPLAERLPAGTFEVSPSPDGMPAILVPAEHLVEVCRVLRDDPALRFAVCVDVTAADYYPREPRFEVVYHLVSPDQRLRLRVRVYASGPSPSVPSVSGVWASANWQEREVLDLFGIGFAGHPNPARLIMPEDWDGHPLRKDYPVQVKMPVRTYEPLQLTEEEFEANLAADRLQRGAGPGTGRP